MINADIELILQNKVEENANLLSANNRKQEEHMVAAEDIGYKTRYEHLLSSSSSKN